MDNLYIDALIVQLNEVSRQVKETFAPLNTTQLNWKPAPNKWSIAQCLDHLMVSNSTYYPEFDRIIKQQPFTNWWGKIPFLPALAGKMLLDGVKPTSTIPLPAPGNFTPSNSDIPDTIVQDFDRMQQTFIGYFTRLQTIPEHERVLVTSPVARFITYSLKDCLNILTFHEQRHLQQALRVMKMDDFPK